MAMTTTMRMKKISSPRMKMTKVVMTTTAMTRRAKKSVLTPAEVKQLRKMETMLMMIMMTTMMMTILMKNRIQPSVIVKRPCLKGFLFLKASARCEASALRPLSLVVLLRKKCHRWAHNASTNTRMKYCLFEQK